MNKEELVKRRDSLRQELAAVNSQFATLRVEESKALVGGYFKYDDTNASVYMTITGVDTPENLKCDMIVRHKDSSFSITKGGIISREYASAPITKEDFEVVKSEARACINTML